ncbi:MAG: oligopeptide/dipeptide ABC transporter ATP-binding protein, partial [Rubrobacteraceae bacterium]
EKDLTYLFISHDLSVVKYISDRIGVMYLGQLVELADSDDLYNNPVHPYTQALLAAVPIPDPDSEHGRKKISLEGDVPSPVNPPSGCRFRTRCPYATEACAHDDPVWREVSSGHWVSACACVN